jgi:LacI family transcriptional regulator
VDSNFKLRIVNSEKSANMVQRIALVYNARSEFDVKVMGGVAAYFQDQRSSGSETGSDAMLVQVHDVNEVHSWQADGVVANLDHPRTAFAAAESRVPVVGFGDGFGSGSRKPSIPYFFANNEAIGEMAAAHLFEKALRRFAYVTLGGAPRNAWDEQREQAFVRHASKRGGECWVYAEPNVAQSRLCAQFALGEWLRQLPKPIGVMAANDECAKEVLECCRLFEFDVPRQVAVIGVDNNDLMCRLSWPSLTSVERGASRIGYEAATHLHRLMDGKKASSDFVIEPTSVVVRQSTTVSADHDPFVLRAVQFIESHYAQSIKVSDVVSAAGISESVLECRFVKTLGRTIYAAIREARLEHVRRLVSDTEVPLKQIAPETGFSSVQHMTTLFRKAFGQSPARYRKSVAAPKKEVVLEAFDVAMGRGTAA